MPSRTASPPPDAGTMRTTLAVGFLAGVVGAIAASYLVPGGTLAAVVTLGFVVAVVALVRWRLG